MTIIGSAEVEVRANTDKFASGAEKGVADGTKSLVGTAAKIIAAAGLGRLIGSVVRDSLADARESNKVAAQTAAAISSTGSAANVTAGEIANLASTLAAKTGIDDEQIQRSEDLLLTFTGLRNEVGAGNDIFNQATKTLLDMNVALGGDSAIQLGKALNDPIAGISALTRVGVSFSDAQKKVIEDLQKSGDIAGAQKVILAELNKEFGGSAEAVATNSNRLKVVIGNIREDIGNVLIPIIDEVSGKLADQLPGAEQLVIDKFHDLRDVIQDTRVRLEPFVTKLQDLYSTISGNQTLLDGFIVGIGSLAAGFAAFRAFSAVQSAITGVSTAVDAFQLAAAAGLPGLIVAGVVALAAAFTLAYLKIKPFHDAVDAVGRAFRDTVYPIIVSIGRVIRDNLLPVLAVAAAAISVFASFIVAPIAGAATAVVAPILAIVAGVVAVGAAFVIAYQKIKPFRDVVDAVGRFFRDTVLPAIVDVAKAVRDSLGAAFAFVSDTVIPTVVSAFHTVVDTVGSVIGAVVDVVGRVSDGIRTGFAVVREVVAAVSSVLAGPVGKIQDVFQSFLDWFNAHVTPTIKAGVDAVVVVIQFAVNQVQTAVSAIQAVLSVLGDVFRFAFQIVIGVVTPMIDLIQFLGQAFIAGLGPIVDFLGSVFGPIFDVVFAVIRFAVENAVAGVKVVLDVLVAIFQAVGPPILDIVQTVFGFVGDTIVTVFNTVKGIIEGALQFIQGVFQVFKAIFTGDWGLLWDGIKNIVSGAIDVVVSIVKGLFGLIGGAVKAGISIVTSAFQAVWDAITATTKVLVDDVVKFFTDLPGRLIGLVGSILSAGEAIGKAILDGIVSGLKGAVGFVSDIGKAVGNAAISAANFVIDKINSAVEIKLDLGPLGSLSINPPDIPHIPRLAAGGIVTARPGGVLANIAEGGRTEGVFPIGPGVLEGLAAIGKGRGAGNTIDASVTIMGNVYGVDDLNTLLDEHDRRLAALIGAS